MNAALPDFRGRRVLVLGLGESGLAMARWLAARGAELTVADSRSSPPGIDALRREWPGVRIALGPFSPQWLDAIDLVALSPGLPGDLPILECARARGLAITGEIELFAQALTALGWRTRGRLLAVTGTNGKTTVTSLVGHMCREAGLETRVCGNISPAALDALVEAQTSTAAGGHVPDAWVLELSSFQLETVTHLAADAATVLNVSADHLDRYPDLDSYARAKARLLADCVAPVLNRDDARVMAMPRPRQAVWTFGLHAPANDNDFGLVDDGGRLWLARGGHLLLAADELALYGRHNLANVLAALALCTAAGLPMAPLLAAARSFRGLPHRVQLVAEHRGVRYIDDSKGTNVGATLAALEGLGRKVVLIAGGDGKGQDFAALAPAVCRHARAVLLIGRDAELIEAALVTSGVPRQRCPDLADAVRTAMAIAEAGDAVLLSPACASWDMFRDYRHRAEVFARAVTELIDAEAVHDSRH
ncbi:MAG: UDP-N-acetylmuramoyl-L-alanine--D-glutamate ligase [Rhodocyclaceae bacterium]|nr:UDP-N-acetylmuramoyl-L-alanine--D-glutamate ligase [Rhodocyclaceae bacterium]